MMLFLVFMLMYLGPCFCINLHFVSFSADTKAEKRGFQCCSVSQNPTRGFLSCAKHCATLETCDGYAFSQNTCAVLFRKESQTCKKREELSRELTGTGNRVLWRKDRQNAKPTRSCPASFTYNGTLQFCFKITNRTVIDYDEAESMCRELHRKARLVKLNTTQRHQAVRQELEKSTWMKNTSQPHILIGAKQKPLLLNRYKWTDGSDVSTDLEWCKGQPQRLNCIRMWPAHKYCLDDGVCSFRHDMKRKKLTYVCEIPLDG